MTDPLTDTTVRDALAAAAGIPDAMRDTFITGTDPATIQAQCAAFTAAFGNLPAAPPAFVPIPGQGQAGPPASAPGAAYADYYDQNGRPVR